VETKLASLKSALEGDDLDRIKDDTEALMTSTQQFSQRLYEQADADYNAASADATPDGGIDDDIVDAEIVEDDA